MALRPGGLPLSQPADAIKRIGSPGAAATRPPLGFCLSPLPSCEPPMTAGWSWSCSSRFTARDTGMPTTFGTIP